MESSTFNSISNTGFTTRFFEIGEKFKTDTFGEVFPLMPYVFTEEVGLLSFELLQFSYLVAELLSHFTNAFEFNLDGELLI